MKYKAIFCDVDGVLVKSTDLFAEELKKEFGIDREVLQPFFLGVFSDCRIGKADLKIELSKVLGDWGWGATVEELMDFWFTKGTQIDHEILDYIRGMKERGVRCFLTTDQEHYRAESLKAAFGNGNPFEHVFASADIGCTKNDPKFFEEVYAKINKASRNPASELITRDRILVIDDGERNIEAARSLGFDTHLYKDFAGFGAYDKSVILQNI